MSKYTLDVFTEKSLGTKFPENTYESDSVEECSKVILNCSRKIAGIKQVQVWINEPNEED